MISHYYCPSCHNKQSYHNIKLVMVQCYCGTEMITLPENKMQGLIPPLPHIKSRATESQEDHSLLNKKYLAKKGAVKKNLENPFGKSISKPPFFNNQPQPGFKGEGKL